MTPDIPKTRAGIAHKAASSLMDSLKKCDICPRRCNVDRTRGACGYCRAGSDPVVYSYIAHHGEEPPLSGRRGSGTIFFAHCNMKCVYCQNYRFSQLDEGRRVSIERLADIMLHLEKVSCHNINLVSPTHFVPQIAAALAIAFEKGLAIPIVYNTSGYDLAGTIGKLRGLIDIYMPDMRYSDDRMALKYSDAPDYVEHNRACIREMYRQVGDLVLDRDGVAEKGFIIRLLVLPDAVSGTTETLRFIRKELSDRVFLSMMSQYHPTYRAGEFAEMSRPITREEYANALDEAKKLGLNNGWVQEEPDARFLGTNIRPGEDII
jgi:putative pyruvate formate lyase activating enzyme